MTTIIVVAIVAVTIVGIIALVLDYLEGNRDSKL